MRRYVLILLLAAAAGWYYGWSPRDIDVPGMVTDRANCDPSYPKVCISPPPPFLSCEDLSVRSFKVFGDDPHSFDPDRDGVGCES